MKYEAIIGLEVHVQVKTKSKMFSACEYRYGKSPNTLTDPTVLALPGTLPTINAEAIRQAVKAGIIFGCKISTTSKWDRKNYFYPDCPKNYQISQNDNPLCRGGSVEIELEGPARNVMGEHKNIKLNRIHLEEDVGKLTHFENESLIDYNRAGVPLIEIVSEPDIHSPEEAFAYLNSLRIHLVYAGISDCDMEKGQMRCDANVSVRPVGQRELGTKVELKNLNSISGVKHGIEYEIRRQRDVLGSGGVIHQETRRWNAEACVTALMRTKETAHDYRYFTDPDLMPVKISEKTQIKIRSELPEMPFAKQERFRLFYNLPYALTSVLYPEKFLSDYFEETLKFHNSPRTIANFIVNELLHMAGTTPLEVACEKVSPQQLAKLAKLVDSTTISKQSGKEIFSEMYTTGEAPEVLVDKRGLRQNVNTDEIKGICKNVICDNPRAVNELLAGKGQAINVLKGKVIKATHGKANPQLVDRMMRELLNLRP
ncbi:MAG: Asp-tRNA(Asn)/Glu-tRNA(Gln) amidotransferase subunit GatB [Puniceicoccales bacterium]|jgi:aspartyl-tRNA(Asn)/glutamyl-tRNA(Gln) amidotransferase subunit B|nr:Asp-tRNA(Asn)/Glu-tRNA(Gln) amidotransferase subunit GatB [Puniceicoccales bacterium]